MRVPLAFPQHLLRFLDVLHPGQAAGAAFVISAAYRLTGPVDDELLRLAVDDVTARHDALRSTLQNKGRKARESGVWEDGEGLPWQEIVDPLPGRFEVVELTAGDDWLDELDTRDHPGDAPPLLWVYYGRLGPADGVLALVAHHSAADAWSMDLLIQDLARCYTARSTASQPPLVAGSTYADFAVADQARRDSPQSVRAIDYWSEKLADVEVSSLPTDRPRELKDDGVRAQLRFTLDPDLAARLTGLGRRARCSPFMVHLSAYVMTLHQLTGSTDITVPTLTSGRGRTELDGTVGFFLNALLLRTDLSGRPSPTEVLARVRATCLDAYRNELPVLRLLEEVPDAGLLLADESFLLLPFQHIPVQPRKTRSFGPETTYVSFDRRPGPRPHGVAVPLDGLWTIDQHATDQLTAKISYAPALFDAATVESYADTYLDCLAQLIRTNCTEQLA